MKWRNVLIGFIVACSLFVLVIFAIFGAFYIVFSGGSSVHTRGNIGIVEVTGVISSPKEILENIVLFAKNDDIRAIVLRVESPGGGVGAAQEIYREVIKTRDTKKVVASLGGVAASGGYYVACGADRIVSNPGTITGSIGVLMEFVNYEELLAWAKIKPKVLKSGSHKDIGSPIREMTPTERAILQNLITEVHEQFIVAIAEGRSLEIDAVRAISDGRILTGQQAKEVGLVDELGNFQDAVQIAADLVGIEKDPKIVYPVKRKTKLVDYLLDSISTNIVEGLNQTSTQSLMYMMPRDLR